MSALDRLSNWQIATLAAWDLGGAASRVDTEDIAVLTWQWAPRRFGMKKFPEHPDVRVVGEALRDAKKPKNGALLTGVELEGGWSLTSNGVRWIEENQGGLRSVSVPGRSSLPIEVDNALGALRAAAEFESWRADGKPPTRYEIAHLIGLTADAPLAPVKNRLHDLQTAAEAGGHSDIKEFLAWLEKQML